MKTVVNYDAAKDVDSHVHRIGRTGRGEDPLSTLFIAACCMLHAQCPLMSSVLLVAASLSVCLSVWLCDCVCVTV